MFGNSRRGFHRDHLKRVHVAVLVADRDVFARHEGVAAESIAGLVILFRRFVIVEHPARMLRATRLVHELADLVVLLAPEAAHAAMLAVCPPQDGVDMALCIERRHELVAVLLRAQGELLRARKIEADALEFMRQLGHEAPPWLSGARADLCQKNWDWVDMAQDRDNVQDAVFRLLGSSATHGGQAVRRIDTHAASVFLAGDRVLKVKRAVRFPFLDYSTVEKRRAACMAELEVNRVFAPDIYRRVVPITREADGELKVDGRGEAVEWAVEMSRFDEDATLDRLAGRGRIDDALADQLGRTVAAAHAAAAVVDGGPWIAALADIIEQNAAAFREAADLFPQEAAARLTAQSRDAWRGLHPLLSERGRMGLVRRGHGDLHLGNIALIEGRPVLFDAIEFDPLIAQGDVLYDLGFLLMDLVERNLARAANIVLNRYLAETRRREDLDALRALPLFLSLRAAIRAKVTAARGACAPASRRDHAAADAMPA